MWGGEVFLGLILGTPGSLRVEKGGTWVKATRSSGTSTWRHVCVCVGGWLWPGGGGTGVSDQRVDVYSVDSTGSTALPIFERE